MNFDISPYYVIAVHNTSNVHVLYMNMKKTKIMWFNRVPAKEERIDFDNNNCTIRIDGTNNGLVNTYTYVGVELDCLLTFDKHLDSVVNKVIQKLYIFRKIRRLISLNTAILVYKQMISPLLEYCNFVHNSGKKLKCEKIDNIQSKCLRIIEYCNNKSDRKKEDVLINEYKIPSLQSRRHMQLACIMYRYIRNVLFTDGTKNRENLRSEGKIRFRCIFSKVAKIRNSPFYRGVDLWNSLKVEHHRAENKKRFKKLIKNLF